MEESKIIKELIRSLHHWKNWISSIEWRYWRKRLENRISIVLSNSIVWKCFPWCGNISQEILWKYSRNKTSILWKRSSFSSAQANEFLVHSSKGTIQGSIRFLVPLRNICITFSSSCRFMFLKTHWLRCTLWCIKDNNEMSNRSESDPCSYEVTKQLQNSKAPTRFEPMTSAIPVWCSNPAGASDLFLGFICNCLSYLITARITFTCILYPRFTHIIFIECTCVLGANSSLQQSRSKNKTMKNDLLCKYKYHQTKGLYLEL